MSNTRYIIYIYSLRYDDCTNALREIYEDKDGERKKEVQALSGPNEFGEFYSRYLPDLVLGARLSCELVCPCQFKFAMALQL